MKDLLKWFARTTLIGIFWVFALSISINGRTVFSHANEVLVQNDFVRMLDSELASLWDKVYSTATVTFNELSGRDQKS